MVATAALHIVVTGGGVGGAAAALLLATSGARVTLLERVQEPKAVGAAILLAPNGLAVLYGLGFAPRLHACGSRGSLTRIQDAAARPILLSETPDFGDGLDHDLLLRRSDLLSTLVDAVRTHPQITSRFGAEVVGATTAGAVSVHENGRTSKLEADLVVGADGVHSCIRGAGDFGARIARRGTSYVRGLVSGQAELLALVVDAWTSLGRFGMGAVPGGIYFFASTSAPSLAGALAREDLSAFRAQWEHAYPPARAVLSRLERFQDLLVNEVVRVDCRRFVDGRLVLLGDAAHAMAPALAQGANSALVDAAVLAYEVGRGDNLTAALAAYEARRRRAVRRVQDAAGRLMDLAELRPRPIRWLRDTALRQAARLLERDGRTVRAAQQEDPGWLLATVRELRRQ